MTQGIQGGIYVPQEIITGNVAESTGVFGEYAVRLGTGSAPKLINVRSAFTPYAGFRTAKKVNRDKQGKRDSHEES